MKQLINKFGAAILAFAVVSCQEELSVPVVNSVDIKVVAEDVDEVIASKTYISQSSGDYLAGWTNTDAITLYEFVAGSLNQTVISSGTVLSDNNSHAEFSVTLATSEGTEYLYEAVHPAGAVEERGSGDSKFYRFAIPPTQTLVIDANSTTLNLDPAADVLIGKPVQQNAQASSESGLAFQFKRPGTIGKLSLSGILAGEKIKSVKIAAPVNIVGYSKIDLTTGEVDAGYSATKDITLNIPCTSEQFIETSAGNTYTFYFRCLSGTWESGSKVSVVLTTDKAIYTKEATLPDAYDFDESGLTAFGFDLSNNTERTEVVDYSGQYVIMSGNFVMAGYNTNKYYNKLEANGTTLSDLYEIDKIDNYVWTVTKTDAGYYLHNKEGYLALTSSSNNAHISSEISEYTYFDISVDDANMVVTSKKFTDRTLQYNSGSPRFAFYASSQTAIQFVAWTAKPTISFEAPANLEFNSESKCVSWSTVEGATNGYEYTLDGGATFTVVNENCIDCSGWDNGDYSVQVRVVSTSERNASDWSSVCSFTISGVPEKQYYVKVTENQDDWCGEYLIVYEEGNIAFDGSLETLDAVSNYKSVSISGGKIEATDAMRAIQFTVAFKSGSSTVYSLKSASGKFISGTTINAKASNGMKQADSDAYYEISFNGTSIESKSSDKQMALKYNKSDGQTRFRFYSSGQEDIALYKLFDPRTALATPEITITPDNTNKKITVSWATVDNAADYSVTCTNQTDQTVTGTSCVFTDLEYGKYVVTVQANPAIGSTDYRSSAIASKNVDIVNTTPVITAENPAAVGADATSVEVSYTVSNIVEGTNLTAAVTSGDWISNPQVAADKVTFTLSTNTTSEQRTGTVTLSYTGAQDKVITITQKAAGGQGGDKEPVVLIIDGSQLTSTATTEETTITFGGVEISLSSGAKKQTSSGKNNFTADAILIGKSGTYIYNSTPIPGKITKFEIYANNGASAKVSVGVRFSDSAISGYATGSNTYTATLSTLDNVYDCSNKLTSNCKYFWYQVTNAYNSQVQFRITYIPDNN